MRFTFALSEPYRLREVLAFHARDPEGLAEQVTGTQIRKGFLLDNIPVVLEIKLGKRAECTAFLDGVLNNENRIRQIARHMIGLTIDPTPFEASAANDPLLGPLIAKQRGLRIPQTATPFEALTWAIIGQQINLNFAIRLRQTFIRTADRRHSSGLWCYPDATAVAGLEPETLGRQKFSRAKAETLVRLARLIDTGHLQLENLRQPAEIEAILLAIKGIGPWTVHYALLRGFGCADCSLHGDAGVRGAVHRLSGGEKPTGPQLQALLERFKPYRSLAAAHLWAGGY